MKFIEVDCILYSLENVKRVFTDTKFISDHTPFFHVNIDYTDGTRYTISCGSNEEGKFRAAEILTDIKNILRGFSLKELVITKSEQLNNSSDLNTEYNEIMDIIDKMEFFNQPAGYELFAEKSKELQRIDINDRANDLKKIRAFIDKQYDIIASNPNKSYTKSFYDQLDSTTARINRYKLEGVKELREKLNSLPDNAIYKYQIDNIITEMENKYK